MPIRAKFQCNKVTKTAWNTTEIEASPVYSEKGENKDFADASPSGNFELTIDGDRPASDYFKAGKEYYLDFTEAN